MRIALVVSTCIILALFAAPAQAAKPAPKPAHVIAFFLAHPKLAATPAGQRQLWKMLARLHAQNARLSSQVRSLQSARLPDPGDWLTAVRAVQRVYPGTEGWLTSCSASEGGHGGFVMNTQGSGASGWMQFLPGTFTRMYWAAKADAEARGFRVPVSSAYIASPIGQALAGGWGVTNGRSGEWYGAGC